MSERQRAQQYIAAAIEKNAGAKTILFMYLTGIVSGEQLDTMKAALEGKATLAPDSVERRALSIAHGMNRLTRLSD